MYKIANSYVARKNKSVYRYFSIMNVKTDIVKYASHFRWTCRLMYAS